MKKQPSALKNPAPKKTPLEKQYAKIFGLPVPDPVFAERAGGSSFRIFSLYDTSKYETKTVASSSL